MLAHQHLYRPIGGEQEEAGLLLPPRHTREPVQGGDVTPMQVFEPEHQRALGRYHLYRFGQLPQHAFPCGALGFAL